MISETSRHDPTGEKMRKLLARKPVQFNGNEPETYVTDPDEGDRLYETDYENRLTFGSSNIH